MPIIVRSEEEADRQAAFTVNEAAFGSQAEAKLAEALRDGGFVTASLVAQKQAHIVGHVLFSRTPIITSNGLIPAISLAPMAVLPECQRQGIGTMLVKEGLQHCRDHGHRIVLVLGHPAFYSRFGFSAELAKPLRSPFGRGEAWMALEIAPAALSGVVGRVEYPSPFMAFL